MNMHRYSEEQRRQWVKDKFSRAKTVKQICREASISRATLYNWIEEFKDLSEAWNNREAEKLPATKTSKPELLAKASPETSERYKLLVSSLAGIDRDRTISKKLVAMLIKRFTLTVAQACAVVGMEEAEYGYKPRKPEVEDYLVYEALVKALHEDRSRDFETLYDILLTNHPDWTRKQIKRVYRDGMVYLERKRSNLRWEKAGKASPKTQITATPAAARIHKPGGIWQLALLEQTTKLDGNETPYWMLCIVDEETNIPLNATLGFGIVTTDDLLSFFDKAAAENGIPRKMKIPGKPALAAREITRWVWQHKMALHTLSLNKPENLEAMLQLENMIHNQLAPQHATNREELAQQVEHWLAAAKQ